MKFSDEQLEKIFDKTCGECHICRKRLAYSNYGKVGRRGAWEVEHSNAQANGGTHNLNNLYAAHIRCNRSKGKCSTRSARARHGFRCAPYSQQRKKRNAWRGAGLAALCSIVAPPHLRVGAAIVLSLAGAILGYNKKSK